MENLDIISSVLNLGEIGFLVWLFLKERARSTEVQDARIADLKSRILFLERLVRPAPPVTTPAISGSDDL